METIKARKKKRGRNSNVVSDDYAISHDYFSPIVIFPMVYSWRLINKRRDLANDILLKRTKTHLAV